MPGNDFFLIFLCKVIFIFQLTQNKIIFYFINNTTTMKELATYEVNVFPAAHESLFVTAEFPPYARSKSQPVQAPTISNPNSINTQVASRPIFPHQLVRPFVISNLDQCRQLKPVFLKPVGRVPSESRQTTPAPLINNQVASKPLVKNESTIIDSRGSSPAEASVGRQLKKQQSPPIYSRFDRSRIFPVRYMTEYRNGIQYELAPVVYLDKTIKPPSPTSRLEWFKRNFNLHLNFIYSEKSTILMIYFILNKLY